MRVIEVQFSTSTAFSSLIIRRICHSPFSHVDIVVPDGLLGASDSEDAPVVQGNPRGVAIRPNDYQEFGIRRRARLQTADAIASRFFALASAEIGKPFDNGAINSFLGNHDTFDEKTRDWREPDKWFCMELIVWCLEQAGFFPYDLIVAKEMISPADGLLLLNAFMLNADTFWSPLEGVKLGPKER